jgi:hypothetical protein
MTQQTQSWTSAKFQNPNPTDQACLPPNTPVHGYKNLLEISIQVEASGHVNQDGSKSLALSAVLYHVVRRKYLIVFTWKKIAFTSSTENVSSEGDCVAPSSTLVSVECTYKME